MKNEFAVIGAGGHAKVVIEIIEEMGGTIKEIIDSNPAVTKLLDYPVAQQTTTAVPVIIAIGNNITRRKIAGSDAALKFGKAIHPKANLSKRSTIGEGTAVMAGATINADTVIGDHCIINTNASIDHDCKIANFTHISPNAALAGNISVGEGTHIGIGSSILQGVTIGKWVTIGAGAVILKDVPDYAVVVGVPGEIIKYNKEV